MKSKKVAIIDVDDTIAQFRHTLRNIIEEIKGENISMDRWDCTNLDKTFDVSFDHVFEIMIDRNTLVDDLTPEQHASSLLNYLNKNDYYIDILTARGWHPRGKQVTEQWLQKHDLCFDEVTSVPMDMCKEQVLSKKYKDVDLTIDDNPKHCLAYADSNVVKNTYLIDRMWNKDVKHHNIKRINCLSDLIEKS